MRTGFLKEAAMEDLIVDELNGGECKSYLVGDRASGLAWLIDPLLDRVSAYLERLKNDHWKLTHAIDTHTHADHLSGVWDLARATGAKTAGAPQAVVELPLKEGDALSLGAHRMEVWGTPGHT